MDTDLDMGMDMAAPQAISLMADIVAVVAAAALSSLSSSSY